MENMPQMVCGRIFWGWQKNCWKLKQTNGLNKTRRDIFGNKLIKERVFINIQLVKRDFGNSKFNIVYPYELYILSYSKVPFQNPFFRMGANFEGTKILFNLYMLLRSNYYSFIHSRYKEELGLIGNDFSRPHIRGA